MKSNDSKQRYVRVKTAPVRREIPVIPPCIICADIFDFDVRYPCVGRCNHAEVCSICALRMRGLMKDTMCTICKNQLEKVIVVDLHEIGSDYDQFEVFGDVCCGKYYDERSQMFFPSGYFQEHISPLWKFTCKVCGYNDFHENSFQIHCKKQHNLDICQLCVENRQSFPSEHVCYDAESLAAHFSSSFGHPMCEFCNTRLYDMTSLNSHMHQSHFACHICPKTAAQRFYRDYDHLSLHFSQKHFPCRHLSCLEKKFVVFDSTLSLQVHNHEEHGQSGPKFQQVAFHHHHLTTQVNDNDISKEEAFDINSKADFPVLRSDAVQSRVVPMHYPENRKKTLDEDYPKLPSKPVQSVDLFQSVKGRDRRRQASPIRKPRIEIPIQMIAHIIQDEEVQETVTLDMSDSSFPALPASQRKPPKKAGQVKKSAWGV